PLKKHTAARKVFEAFSPSAQREYVEWITEAKTDATRQKRIATSLEWLAEGKHRNWKYQT
ncbi:YdeI/OmpD-associated family protein, partial [Dyella sp.]|uniref:YdeI/OmpD-associated family protein n=1 Tax=Dyella sp. TaxID=1869338 RepID=UPI002B48C31C